MEKRAQKLQQSLEMVMLRLRDSIVFQGVEIETPAGVESLTVEGPNGLLADTGKHFSFSELAAYISRQMTDAETGSIRFHERGALVTIEVLANDVRLKMSTATAPSHLQPVETGTRQQFIKVEEARELLQALDIASPEGKVRADRRRKYY